MKRARILLVDDEVVVRKLGLRLLSDSYEVTLAASTAEALEIIARTPLDLLITDWSLQDGTGKEVITAFTRNFPGAPCILITGFLDTEEFLAQASGLPLAARFHKPFDITIFIESVKKALGPSGGESTPPAAGE